MQIPLILNLWKMAPVSFFVNKEEGIAKHSWVAKSRGPWKWSLEVQTKRRLSGKQQFLLNDVTWLDCRAILPPAPARIMSDKEGIESTNGSCLAVLFSRGISRLTIDAHSDLQDTCIPKEFSFSASLTHFLHSWSLDNAMMTRWCTDDHLTRLNEKTAARWWQKGDDDAAWREEWWLGDPVIWWSGCLISRSSGHQHW